MTEIEFLDPDEIGGPATAGEQLDIGPTPRPRRPFTLSVDAVAAIVLLAAAAALPVIASFQPIVTIEQRFANVVAGSIQDAWGRYQTFGTGSAPANGLHAARYGIAFCTVAGGFGVLAVLMVLTGLPAVRARASRALGAAIAVAAGLVGVQAGVTAAIVLGILEDRDNARTTAAQEFAPSQLAPQVVTGAAVWIGLAGVVAGLMAIGALVRLRRAETATQDAA